MKAGAMNRPREAARCAIGACLLLASQPAAAAPAGRKVTVDELMKLPTVSNVRLSPDGTEILYVVSEPDLERNEHVPVLWRVAVAGGAPARLTHTTILLNRPLPDPQAAWSPDGEWISFLALADGVRQVFAMRARGGEARPLTRAATGVGSYSWAPDARRLAYVAAQPAAEEEIRRRAEQTFVIDPSRGARPTRVWVQSFQEQEAARAITPLEHFVHAFSWSPDGGTIAYSASASAGFTAPYRTSIYTVPASGGDARSLLQRPGMNSQPLWSPDGRWVAFLTTEGVEHLMANLDLAIVPATGGAVVNLTEAADQWVGEFVWGSDSDSIYYLTDYPPPGAGAGMFERHIRRARISDGTLQTLTQGRRQCFGLSLDAAGRKLAFKASNATSMGDVLVATLDPWTETRITDLHPRMRELDWGALQPVSWTSFDGMEIWGLLLTPPGYTADHPIPLVVYAHGGPIGSFGYAVFPQFPHMTGQVTPYPVQAMAAEGMAVLMPMPRGGAGYGEEGFRMITGSWGEGDYRDIMAGVDRMIAAGIADESRLGVMGASYGGFMTSWIVTQTDRFAAASTGASVNDLYDLYSLSDGGDFALGYFGAPWDNLDAYLEHSPLTYAARVQTPLLIQHGESDPRVPVEQARELYKVLDAMGKNVELEIYPRGGHVLYEPRLQREQQLRNLRWFKRWLNAPGLPS